MSERTYEIKTEQEEEIVTAQNMPNVITTSEKMKSLLRTNWIRCREIFKPIIKKYISE